MLILHPVGVRGISSPRFTAENIGWGKRRYGSRASRSAQQSVLLTQAHCCLHTHLCCAHVYRHVPCTHTRVCAHLRTSIGKGDAAFFNFLKIFLFIYLAVSGLIWDLLSLLWRDGSLVVCSMWDLVPWSRIEPRPPALEAQSLSHWTTGEVPFFNFLFWKLSAYAKMRRIAHWAAVFTQIHHLWIFAQLFLLSL